MSLLACMQTIPTLSLRFYQIIEGLFIIYTCFGVVTLVQETAHKEVNLSLIQEAQKKRQMKQVYITLFVSVFLLKYEVSLLVALHFS